MDPNYQINISTEAARCHKPGVCFRCVEDWGAANNEDSVLITIIEPIKRSGLP